jgi:hypothetical protein
VRFQKLMWRNMMKSTKSKKTSVLHYNIDIDIDVTEEITCLTQRNLTKEMACSNNKLQH